jgi:hypothetical protein
VGRPSYIRLAIVSLLHSYGAVQAALVAIWLSVALGAALGIGQRFAPRVTEPIRTFAVVAAGLVVGLSLLPHALECEGIGGLIGAALGYGAIPALERIGGALFRRVDPNAMRLELGYSGLLLHRFGDGVAMSVEGHGYGVLWALGAHEVPIVALVTLAFARRGLGVALARAIALGLSSSLGYALVSALPAATWGALHGWADAIAAGVLVHMVAHEGFAQHTELPPGAPPLAATRPLSQRVLNLAAGLLACALIVGLGLDRESGSIELLGALISLALQAAPWLCLGWLAHAALRAAPVALPAASRALAEPLALALTAGLIGGRFALVYAVAALAGALLAARIGLPREAALPGAARSSDPLRAEPFWSALERRALPGAGWVCLGLLAATYAHAYVPAAAGAAGLSSLARLGFCCALGALARVSAPAAALLAAALLSKGLPEGFALLGLLLGPLLRRASARSASAHVHA